MTTTAAQTVELPPGVKHWTTTATAETWEAWEALTSADGWELREWDVEPNVASPDGRHVQKEALIRGHRIVVFRPLREPCRSCGGEGGRMRYTRGSIAPDPQTEEVCDRCEGDGIEPGDER